MTINLQTPTEVANKLAQQVKAKRLSMNLSQKTLAERAGVSYAVLKKFERTGKISLESLLKLALVLNSLAEFESLFTFKSEAAFATLDELLLDTSRKRGRE